MAADAHSLPRDGNRSSFHSAVGALSIPIDVPAADSPPMPSWRQQYLICLRELDQSELDAELALQIYRKGIHRITTPEIEMIRDEIFLRAEEEPGRHGWLMLAGFGVGPLP